MATDAIHAAWQTARSLGLFETGAYDPIIQVGPDTGENVVIQYIVPPKLVPEFSRSFCNVELVPPSEKRTSEDPADFDTRRTNHLKRLLSYAKRNPPGEHGFPNTGRHFGPSSMDKDYRQPDGRVFSFGQTKQEYEARWRKLRKANPESAKLRPMISPRIDRKEGPSKKNNGKYIYSVIFKNISGFPTEITYKLWFVGKSNQGGSYVSLLKKSETVKILPGDSFESQESFTATNASFRGYAALVFFDDTLIDSIASDARMASLIEGNQINRLRSASSGKKGKRRR